MIHDAAERCLHGGELHARLGQRHVGVGLGLVELGLSYHQLAARYGGLIGQLIDVLVFNNQVVGVGLRPGTEQG